MAQDTDLERGRPARARRDVQGGSTRRRRAARSRRTRASSSRRAVRAVFDSWDTPRAQVYRRAHEIPDDLGTAVNVVQMVFGNKGEGSGTGVCFTRDPSTGEQGLYGEFLVERAGRGRRRRHPHAGAARARCSDACPRPSTQLARDDARGSSSTTATCRTSSSRSRTGALYLLQTRSAKRTAAAALKAAVEMVEEGLITREEAVARIDPAQLDQLLHPMIDPTARRSSVAAKGLNASPGAACGRDRLRRGHGRASAARRRGRDPRPLGDDARTTSTG